MGDYFSKQADLYSQFRPTYPKNLYQYLAEISPNHNTVWDCGTGNGQAAIELSKYFNQVIATDLSEKQIQYAPEKSNIIYLLSKAEYSPLLTQSVDLITVAQAAHWFNPEKFNQEVRRVLKPSGILAIWCYSLFEITDEIDQPINHLFGEVLKSYWPEGRENVDTRYQTLPFDYPEIDTPEFSMTAEWTLDHVIGYLNTWSAVQNYKNMHHKNPIDLIEPELRKRWGNISKRTARWPLGLRVARI